MVKKNLRKNAALFSALGDETRLYLMQKLGNIGELSISELSEGLSLSRQAVTKHLRILKAVELVKCHRRGRESRFKLHAKTLEGTIDLLKGVERKWDQRLMRLKIYVENSD